MFTKHSFPCTVNIVEVWNGRCCIGYMHQLHFKFVGISQTLSLSVQFGPKYFLNVSPIYHILYVQFQQNVSFVFSFTAK